MLFRKLLRWARITKAGDDDKQFATQQLEYMGKVANATTVTPFGYHANATPDFLTIIGAVGGDPDNRVTVGGVAANRPQLAAGEIAFYHPATGGFIIWRVSGNLEINAGIKDINFTAANFNFIGDTAFTGVVTANGKVIDDTHGHTQDNDTGNDVEEDIIGVI